MLYLGKDLTVQPADAAEKISLKSSNRVEMTIQFGRKIPRQLVSTIQHHNRSEQMTEASDAPIGWNQV